MVTAKIPVRIEWIAGEGGGSVEIVMELRDFESSGTSIRARLKKFKKKYETAIANAKKADSHGSRDKRAVPTMQRWRACKILADFNGEASNDFEITNYREAYARDFGLPTRSIRTYLDFGSHFAEDEILDEIPYSVYAELVFRMSGLRAVGLFESEKKNLAEMGRAGKTPNRDEYRERLRNLSRKTTG